MNSPKLTIVLLALVIGAAMWTSGRLTLLLNTIMGKETGTHTPGRTDARTK